MKRKLGGLVVAAVLFVVGTLLLVSYVRSAEQRAVGAEEQIEVLVVSQPVEPGGAPVVRIETFPARLVGDDVVRAADSLEGLVASAALVPGEALVWSRLGAPGADEGEMPDDEILDDEEEIDVLVVSQPVEPGGAPVVRTEALPARLVGDDVVRAVDSLDGFVAAAELIPGQALAWSVLGTSGNVQESVDVERPRVEVPDGFAAVTIPIGTERALGGLLEPGVRVAVVGSFEINVDPDDSFAESKTVQTTHVLVDQALVVDVQSGEPSAPGSNAIESGFAGPSTTSFLVTVAAPIYDVERIVFANEWGSVWLAQQGEGSDGPTQIQTADTIFDQFEGTVSISGGARSDQDQQQPDARAGAGGAPDPEPFFAPPGPDAVPFPGGTGVPDPEPFTAIAEAGQP